MTATAPEIHRGLAGVVVDTTAIQETNSLTYRGYPVQEPAARRNEFQAQERALRPLDRTTAEVLARLPETCHPMDVLRMPAIPPPATASGTDRQVRTRSFLLGITQITPSRAPFNGWGRSALRWPARCLACQPPAVW